MYQKPSTCGHTWSPAICAALFLGSACGGPNEDAPRIDGGPGADAAADAAAITWDAGDSGSPIDNGCGRIDARPTRTRTRMWIVADAGEIVEFPGASANFREVVLDDTNALAPHDAALALGAIWVTGSVEDTATCPSLQIVEPAADNVASMVRSFPRAPVWGGTFAASYALAHIADALSATPSAEPTHVLLFSMGSSVMPCANDPRRNVDGGGFALLLDEVMRLRAAGAVVHVIDYGENWPSPYTADDYAAAGGSGQALSFNGGATDLRAELSEVVKSSVSCEVAIDGRVDEGNECRGEVRIGSEVVPCNTADGYRLKGPSTLELLGKACAAARADANVTITARFDCEVLR